METRNQKKRCYHWSNFNFLFLYELYRGKKRILFHPSKRCQVFVVHEKEEKCQCSLWMLPGCWSGSVFLVMCICTFAAGGLKGDRGWVRNEMFNCTHVHMEDSASQTVYVLLSQRTTFKWLSFTSLHRLKLYIYICIYINLLTKCLENIPRNTNISNK